MRVLQVVHGLPPAASGGTEIYVWHLARALAGQPGVQVTLLTREADPNRPEYSVRREQMPGGLAVFRINNTFQACTSFEDSYANPALAAIAGDLIDGLDPDLVHVQHLTCLSTGILERAYAARRPVVMTLNDYWLMCQRGQLLRRDGRRCEGPFAGGCDGCVPRGVLAGPAAYRAGRIARAVPLPGAALAARAAAKCLELTTSAEQTRDASWKRLEHLREATRTVDLFLAPSATMEEWALRFGIDRARLERCDQGIPLDSTKRSAVEATKRSAADAPLRLAFAGSLIPSKAPHLLLEAVDAFPAGRITVDLLGSVVPYHGDTSYASRLAPLLGKPFVRKLGPVPHERMSDTFADVDGLVVPSAWIENAPFVIREAFAAGLPVIASDLGGMAEMVRHERNGLLFAPGDSAALARAIGRLLDEPDLLDRLRQGISRPMSIEEDAAQTVARYARLCGPRSNPRSTPAAIPPTDTSAAQVHAVVLNYRTAEQTWLAARSILASSVPARVLVVDNGSGDGSAERLSTTLPAARIVEAGSNLGFSGGCNLGIRAGLDEGARFVLLVNSDAVLSPPAMRTLLDAARAHPAAGILAPVLLSREEPDRIASAGIRYSTVTGRMRHIAAGLPLSLVPPAEAHAVDAVSGCVMLIRRDVFDAVGVLDEEFFFSFEDIEFCLRARRAGFSVLCVPGAIAYHEGGRSIGRRSADRVYFAARNHLRLARMAGNGHRASWLRDGMIVGLNAGYVLLSGDTPRIRGLAALARGVWHHLAGRYGPG